MFLLPLIVSLLAQSLLTLGILVVQRTSQTIQEYSISMFSRVVENRQVILENDMTQRWATVYELENGMNSLLEEFLKEKEVSLDELWESADLKNELLTSMFPECMSLAENNATTGAFVILTDGEKDTEGDFDGFFVRDSNPRVSPVNYSDLLMERGNKQLSRTFSISMDTYWTTSFHMSGCGKEQDEKYFYEPWRAASEYPSAAIENLGYWAEPFVLDSGKRDSHEMITYSIPLRYQDSVYAVMGVEIATSYLYEYLPVEELNSNEQAGYMLALEDEQGNYKPLLGQGVMYDAVNRSAETFTLEDSGNDGLWKVKDIYIGSENIYAVTFPLKLYSSHVPYSDTQWVLIGFDDQDDLFGLSRQLYLGILAAMLLGLIFGILCISIVVHRLTKPIKRLMKCISGGEHGLNEYRKANIFEVDALHDVVKDLTEKQKKSADVLLEEKELYRLALETTADTFFSYDLNRNTLDIVNHPSLSGHWDCSRQGFRMIDPSHVHEDDREALQLLLTQLPDVWNLDLRLRRPGETQYHWRALIANVICDTEGRRWKVVGRFCDIDEQKLREEEERKKYTMDGVTGFYSYQAGLEKFDEVRTSVSNGAMLCIRIGNMRQINVENGITFGDMILEEFGKMIRVCSQDTVLTLRANGDTFCIWMPEGTEQSAIRFVLALQRQIQIQFEPTIFKIVLWAGIAVTGKERTQEAILKARQAQIRSASDFADGGYRCFHPGEDVSETIQTAWEGKQLVTTPYGANVNLVSLALMLFGKGNNQAAQMRLLFRKTGECYGAGSVQLITLAPDFHSTYVECQWNENPQSESSGRAVVYKDQDRKAFEELFEKQSYLVWKKGTPLHEKARFFCQPDDAERGCVMPLYDNGTLTGVLCLLNPSLEKLESESEMKNLLELSRVIQSQMNQQRHDLASQAKSEFLSRMSHEIRTPMNGIIGMTTIALNEKEDPKKVESCLEKIQTSSEYLLDLINDILDMSKIESGKMNLQPVNFSMQELIDTVKKLICPQAETKEIAFEQDISLEHTWFVADRLRISQILINLLGNAVKFTPKEGKIVLTVREEPHEEEARLFISVRDNGIGIRKEDQERIFRAFEQTRSTQISGQPGTGLGLSISSRLIKMMGSTIRLKSAPGEGSEFYFTLSVPLGNAMEAQSEDVEVSFDGYRVLVVEDNELNAEISQSILEEAHFTVDLVYNGAEAVQRMKESEPGTYDLILMDIMMPVMDGLEATKAIRAMDREDLKTIPIIAMSANVFDDDMKKSVECGMNGHLSKPVEVRKMYSLLTQILKGTKRP
jgi:signal transduction histidine kinase/CheY-like chemotaxis protein/GGDEF domain-containing protein/PAS domain-containing protein